MIKNKILMGLGTISAAAIPALAVVACGSDDKKDATNQDNNASVQESLLTGEEFLKLVDDSAEDFLNDVKDQDAAVFTVPADLTIAKYNQKVDALTATTEVKDAIKNIVAINDNDPILAAYVIQFTITTIKYERLAVMGLVDSSFKTEVQNCLTNAGDISTLSAGAQALYAKMHGQISGAPLKASVIALGLMQKFNKEDPIWGPTTTDAFIVSPATKPVGKGATITAGGGTAAMAAMTMGGMPAIERIVTSQGYLFANPTNI